MFTTESTPYVIEKNNIDSRHFPALEVLRLPEEIKQRKADAEKGMVLGNNYKSKVKILFKDDECVKQVETTIWGVTDSRVILKTGMGIPLHRILRVKF
jgi:hypothetical protein